MLKRIITGAIMLGILLPLIIIKSPICEVLFAVVVVFISVVGTFEYVNGAYKSGGSFNPVLKKYRFLVAGFSGMIAFLCCNATYNMCKEGNFIYHIYPMLTYLISVIVILFLMLWTKDSQANDIGHCIVGLTYSGLLLGYAFSLRYFEPTNINKTFIDLNGRQSFMYVYTIVLLTDTFAYLVGCKWGKRKMAPTISPKKSVEGAFGGLVAGILFGVAIIFLYQIIDTTDHLALVILIGAIISGLISCAVQFGDLVESKFKRSFDVKDFGKILPGHGGILDRFDSFIYSGIIFYVVFLIIEIALI